MFFQLLIIPEEYGGMDMNVQSYVILREKLTKGMATSRRRWL